MTTVFMPIAAESGFQVSDTGIVIGPDGRELRQHVHKNGLRVRIRRKRYMVRRLVIEAFAGKPVRGTYRIRDRNGDPFDNRAINLVYAGGTRTSARSVPVDHCRKNHELTGDNVKTWGAGRHRICVQCLRDRARNG